MKTWLAENGRALALIGVIAIFTSLIGTWRVPINRNQEGRIAVTAREAVTEGHWLIPTMNGQIRLQKPPLMTWIVAGSYLCFGAINEFAARFPSFLFGLASALLLYGLGRSLLGKNAALISAVVLMTSFEFIRMSRQAEIDVALMCATIGAMTFWYRAACVTHARRDYWIGFLFCALAFNLKGPPGLLPCLAFAVFLLATRAYREIRSWLNPLAIIVCLALCGLWYGLVFQQLGTDAIAVFSKEVDDTFIQGSDHHGNPFYYVYTLVQCFAPWTLFMYAAVALIVRRSPKTVPQLFILCWAAVTFLVLSVNPNKQPHYTLLLLPPAALLTGWLAEHLLHTLKSPRRVYIVTGTLAALMIIGTLADTLWLHERLVSHASYARNIGRTLRTQIPPAATVYTYGFTDAALAFYYEGKIPALKPDALKQMPAGTGDTYLIVKEKDRPTLTGVTDVTMLVSGKKRLFLCKVDRIPQPVGIPRTGD